MDVILKFSHSIRPIYMFWLVLLLLNQVVLGIIFTQSIVSSQFVLAQLDDKAGDVKGYVVNSKYITIKDHRYQHGDPFDVITGTVINNSTQEIPVIYVIAALYDKNDNLITTDIGSADASDLPSGHNSTFSINLFGLRGDVVYHYTLLLGGTPQLRLNNSQGL
jgi:hypothetical protein